MPTIVQTTEFASGGVSFVRSSAVGINEHRLLGWGPYILGWGAHTLAWGRAPLVVPQTAFTSDGLSIGRATALT